jgi:hypothetical protein
MPKNEAKTKKDKLIRKRVELARVAHQNQNFDLRKAIRAPRDAAVLTENDRHDDGVALLRQAAAALRSAADEFEATAVTIENAVEEE